MIETNGSRHTPHAFLQHTGPGTPAGALLRSYWQPVGLSTDVAAGGTPHPVRVMGEDLVLFRDDAGRPGLVGRKCAHRCADLSYGRVEDGGLRCLYHGWLFDVDGTCLEQPPEPKSSTFKDRVRQKSYPCHEAGGAIWAYMGTAEPPLFPNYPALTAPEAYRFTIRWFSDCNWMQGHEGNIDPVHTSYLHKFSLDVAPDSTRLGVFAADGAPELTVEDTRYGLRIYAERNVPNSADRYLRITNFIMPNSCAINGNEADLGPGGCGMSWNVPIDDLHHWRYSFTFHAKGPLPKDMMARTQAAEKIAGTDLMRRNEENRYLQDRASMDTHFIGLGKVFPVHDIFITQSQGPILDHSEEHLATSDVAILRARKLLAEAAKAVAAGETPRGVVRDPAENNFDDCVVVTKRLPAGIDAHAYYEELAASAMYELNPDLAAQPV
jgi:phenylpropionate dioxygenase-like ring-hydroxylating dioxygenase large terminal subunit